jgi:hypothetical protein
MPVADHRNRRVEMRLLMGQARRACPVRADDSRSTRAIRGTIDLPGERIGFAALIREKGARVADKEIVHHGDAWARFDQVDHV